MLIVGAGPAGLMTALSLSRLGVKTRIIDKRSTKVMNGQADGISPRFLEIMDSFGVAGGVLSDAYPNHDMASWVPGENGITRASKQNGLYAGLGSHTLHLLNQGEIERHLLNAIGDKSDVEVERGRLPVSMTINEASSSDPDAYPVTVEVQHLTADEATPFQTKAFGKIGEIPDGLFRSNLTADTTAELVEKVSSRPQTTETIRAKYVVGTDGAHSWVRQQLGYQLEGDTKDYVWGVMDVVPLTNFPDIRSTSTVQSNNGSMLIIPREKRLTRLYVQMAEVDASGGRDVRAQINPNTIFEQAQKIFAPYKLDYKYCDWWTAYQIGQRISNGFADKTCRVFLAGDAGEPPIPPSTKTPALTHAVHTHSPKGGQGMNVSAQDGHNLGWKLGGVVHGWLPRETLQTYEPERRKVAQDLIELDRQLAATFSGEPTMAELQALYQRNMIFISGYGVHYAPSSLTASYEGSQQPLPGSLPVRRSDPSKHAKGVEPGKLMPSGPLIIHSVSHPVQLQQSLKSDGRWRLLVFAGDITTHSAFDRLHKLGRQLEPIVQRYMVTRPAQHVAWDCHPAALPETLTQSLVDAIAIHCARKEQVDAIHQRDLSEFHPLFFPYDPTIGHEYDKVLIDAEMDAYAALADNPGLLHAGKVYEMLGMDRDRGAMVIVRPDQYVSWVGGLEDVKGVEDFFGGVLLDQSQKLTLRETTEAQSSETRASL